MLTKGPKTKHKRRQQTGFAKRWGRAKPPKLPELMKPDGAGYMPLYCAAQWIAERGGTPVINPLDEAIWREAFKDLLDRIASGDVKVVGERPDGVSEDISGAHFASCSVDYPLSDRRRLYFNDRVLGNEFCLVSYPYLDDERWRRGFDDRLENRRGVRWRRLQALKADVARCWPFGKSQDRRTGAPGPTQPAGHVAPVSAAPVSPPVAQPAQPPAAQPVSPWPEQPVPQPEQEHPPQPPSHPPPSLQPPQPLQPPPSPEQPPRRGTRPKADWSAIEEAFRREVAERGMPDETNDDDWQRQADVERWLYDMLIREGVESISEATLRRRAKDFLFRARKGS